MIDFADLAATLAKESGRLYSRLLSLPAEQTNYSEEDNPAPMDTLGTLVDKLITVDMKMWHNQERLYEIRRMSAREFTDRYGDSLDELHAVIKRCCDLNVQRARLMDAIDLHFSEAVNGQREALVNAQHKTY